MKALNLMKINKTVQERAEVYSTSIKRDLYRKKIEALELQIEKNNEKIFDLENFTLDTDNNRGMRQMTKEDCEQRFDQLIDLKYHNKLLSLEITAKKEIFEEYFTQLPELAV